MDAAPSASQSVSLQAERYVTTSGVMFALSDGANRCSCHAGSCDPCVCAALREDAGGAVDVGDGPASIVDGGSDKA